MKNIHVLPTEHTSRLYYNANDKTWQLCEFPKYHTDIKSTHNIYITYDEKIKEKDWFFRKSYAFGQHNGAEILLSKDDRKIILTTDQDLIKNGVQTIDDDFIEWFIKNPGCEFVNVEEVYFHGSGYYDANRLSEQEKKLYSYLKKYKIIIPKEEPTLANMRCTCMSFDPNCFTGSCRKCGFLPKEEPKQETLEEAANKANGYNVYAKETKAPIFNEGFIAGAKWQQEQDKNKYSAEEVRQMLWELGDVLFNNNQNGIKEGDPEKYIEEIIVEFKNK